MVSRQRTAALCYDVRMLNAVAVGSLNECVDTVVDVFLYRVVDAALAVGRACAVVVDAKSASAVNEVNVIAHLVQLYIELRSLSKGCLYAAYLCYLAADVEVDKAQAVFHLLLFENLEGLEQLRACQSELACVAAALLPLAAS